LRLEDQIILDTPDHQLDKFKLARKKQLQAQIVQRREIRQALAVTPSNKPQQASSLAADQKNRFDRHEEFVRQARIASNTQTQREAKRQQQRQTWNHESGTHTTDSGVRLDAATVQLKKKADASRTAPKQPPRIINLSTLRVCVWAVMQAHPEFFQSEFNAEALNRLVQKQLRNGAEVCPETIEAAYQEGVANNNFEQIFRRDSVTGGRVTMRGSKPMSPPTMPAHVVWGDEAQLIAEEEQAEALRLNSADAQAALRMDFDALQQRIRAGYKRGADEGVR